MLPVPRLIKRAVASSVSLPAPVGGWNARDSLADMEPTDAVTLTNFFPLPTAVMLRQGYTQHATGLGTQVESLMAYAGGTTQKLFAAAGSSFYDVSSGGAVGAAVVTSLSNARWQSVNITTAGGSFMLSVNGADKLRGFDGTNWYADGDGSHDITGVNSANLIHINLFKNRLWFIQSGTLKAWYLGTNAISGAATSFDFQSIARRGGSLIAMGTWTIDAGYGVDDLAVWVTSEGEVIIYKGTDPSSSTTWALVGIYQLGAPIGRRCFMKFAGDLLLISQDGVLPLSGALQSSRVNPRVALTDKIQSAMSTAATNYGGFFGWQLLYYAKANMLFLNVPIFEGSSQEQYVMNTITKSWGQFQGWSANCWEIFSDEPYFGGNGFVGKAWSTSSDNSTNINATAKQAFNYFGTPGIQKRFTMARPIILTNGQPATFVSLDIDFSDTTTSSVLSFSPLNSSTWDNALWDSGIWGGGLSVSRAWQGITGVGYCAAPRFQVAAMGIDVQWVSTDLVFEKGAIL